MPTALVPITKMLNRTNRLKALKAILAKLLKVHPAAITDAQIEAIRLTQLEIEFLVFGR